MARRLAAATVVGASLALAGAARAQDETPDASETDVWASRRISIEAHAGGGTPVGLLGVEGEYSVSSLFAVGLGLGLGLGSDTSRDDSLGPRGAVFGRVRPLRSTNRALVIGVAYSLGNYRAPPITTDTTPIYRSDLAHWAQLDAGIEWRADFGLVIRFSPGAAVMLNPWDVQCHYADAGRCRERDFVVLPTIDLGLGFAF